LQILVDQGSLSPSQCEILAQGGLTPKIADHFVENCIGSFSLPLAIATNFLVNGKDVLVPMAVEESSVVAAASFGAKLVRAGGGFVTLDSPPIATAQVHFKSSQHPHFIQKIIQEKDGELRAHLLECFPRLESRGGGVKNLELRVLDCEGNYCIHIHVNTSEAMGANMVNTMAERLGAIIPSLWECQVGLKILTNLVTQRITQVDCQIPFEALAMAGFSGEQTALNICEAYGTAVRDVFRAATHNKGVLNGIDPVAIATGNDWRAVEAGCHAYAATASGVHSYQPLTHWTVDPAERCLRGRIRVPLAVGTVGGVTKLHPCAQIALQILDHPSSVELAGIMASVGLAQNLSALRALGCEGIQKGHMALHEKNLDLFRQLEPLEGQPKKVT
jgi:hydroxymethylglutaryl-CoA reductase